MLRALVLSACCWLGCGVVPPPAHAVYTFHDVAMRRTKAGLLEPAAGITVTVTQTTNGAFVAAVKTDQSGNYFVPFSQTRRYNFSFSDPKVTTLTGVFVDASQR